MSDNVNNKIPYNTDYYIKKNGKPIMVWDYYLEIWVFKMDWERLLPE